MSATENTHKGTVLDSVKSIIQTGIGNFCSPSIFNNIVYKDNVHPVTIPPGKGDKPLILLEDAQQADVPAGQLQYQWGSVTHHNELSL